jgi:hypothetical protein
VADFKNAYDTQITVTISPASLASDGTLLAGRESTEFDNTSAGRNFPDVGVSGKITTGTNPTVSTRIQVIAIGILGDGSYPDVFDGTDSAETISSANVKTPIAKVISDITVAATSDKTYYFGPVSLRSVFGNHMPRKCVFFVTHNTVAALNATAGNHAIWLDPEYATIT